jgi:ribokinase
MTAKIVVVGSFNADLTSYLERMPRPGETVSGDKFVTGPGGKGSNQAVAAARLGADVTFIGRVGNDVFANLAHDLWTAEGINTNYVNKDPDHATGVAPIFVDSNGENMIVVVLGANNNIQQSDIDAAKDVIADADVLIVQLEINHNMVGYALNVAKELGITTILNPAPAAEIPTEFIKLADYITPNETELETLSRSHSDDVIANAKSLLTSDEQTVVVTMGALGAQIVQNDHQELMGTFKVDVVDTTGAGDAFNGGLAVALAEGKSLQKAVKFANATAALCVTRLGTSPSMPQRAEVDTLYNS